jgi:sec-independent protein translocase protein TatA
MGSMSLFHWIIVLAVVLLLFGTGKISGLMGDVAKGVKAFKKGIKEDDDDHPSPPTSGPTTIEGKATVKEKDPVA